MKLKIYFISPGKNKKIIILDLDNTIWGGVVGETGWEGIRGGHDHIGEAFVDFQKKIKSLTKYGNSNWNNK